MSKKMPELIYLQSCCGGDDPNCLGEEAVLDPESSTHCEEQVYSCDTEYIKKESYDKMLNAFEKSEKNETTLTKKLNKAVEFIKEIKCSCKYMDKTCEVCVWLEALKEAGE